MKFFLIGLAAPVGVYLLITAALLLAQRKDKRPADDHVTPPVPPAA